MRLAMLTTLVLAATLPFATAAQSAPNPRGMPTVLCKEKQAAPGEGMTSVPGLYSYRPHNCLIHKYHLLRSAFQLYAHIHWRFWNEEEAFGVGGIPGIAINYKTGKERVFYDLATIRLEKPLGVCGRQIFTEATIKDQLAGSDFFTNQEALDRVPIPGRGSGACDR